MREKRNLLIVVCCLCLGPLIVSEGSAATADNPYQPIVDRNLFALKDPPPAPDPSEVNKQPPPNIFLQGITTIFGNKRVLLKTTPTAAPGPAKPGAEKPTEQSYILAEGQREGDVEVIEINEKAGEVKIRLAEKEMTLDFENNGIKVAAAPAPGLPGAPGGPTGLPPGLMRPAGLPGGAQVPGVSGSTPPPTLPNRSLRLGTSASTTTTPGVMPGGVYAGNYGAGNAVSSGGLSFGGSGTSGGSATHAGMQPRTAEETALNILQNQAAKEEMMKRGANIPAIFRGDRSGLGGPDGMSGQPTGQ